MTKRIIVDIDLCVGCQLCMFACVRRKKEIGTSKSAIQVKSVGGVERGFIVVVCKKCIDAPCAKACPTGALMPKKNGGVKFIPEKCLGCGNCVKACSLGAVFWDQNENKPSICSNCGYCVKYCPYGAIKFEEKEKC